MRLRNVRAFGDTGWLSLPKITVLFGKNSSGKTTLLRAPLLFSQLVTTQSMLGDVPISGPYVDFGSYPDLVKDADFKSDVEVHFSFDFSHQYDRFFIEEMKDSPLYEQLLNPRIGLRLHWNHPQARSQISGIVVSDQEDNVVVAAERKGPHSIRLDIPALGVGRTLTKVPELSGRFFQILPSLAFQRQDSREMRFAEYSLYSLNDALLHAAASIEHVGPLRDMPKRSYLAESAGAGDGQTQTAVARLASRRTALRAASDALRELRLATSVDVVHPAPGYVGITVVHPQTGRKENLADVGFGTSQVLPIIVQIASARRGTQILIEQPELHLHPETQGALADVLVRLADERDVGLLIESHSEHIFLRLRRRIAEGTLLPEDVGVYIVDSGQVERVTIDSSGSIDRSVFPEDFFEEEWVEAVELARASALK
jgi:predicted ATPase